MLSKPNSKNFQTGETVTLNDKLFAWEATVVRKKDPNQLHLFRKPTFRIRPGMPLTILGRFKGSCYTVVAEGYPTRHRYHEDFLERVY